MRQAGEGGHRRRAGDGHEQYDRRQAYSSGFHDIRRQSTDRATKKRSKNVQCCRISGMRGSDTPMPIVAERALYRWTRDLHLYLGLFVSPFVIAFAISVFFLNHARVDTSVASSTKTFRGVTIPDGIETARGRDAVDRARTITNQVGVSGEIGFVRYVQTERRIVIPVSKPGLETTIDVDLVKRTAVVSRRSTGLLERVAYLHKSPGPHNAHLRGNWLWTQFWRWLADATVYLVLFISATGVYLWLTIKAERRIGLALLGAGAVTAITFLYGLAS